MPAARRSEADVINGNVATNMSPDISSASNAPHEFGRSSGAGDSPRIRYGYLADPRFGFTGTISDQAECEAAGGNFHTQIFGWMIDVYRFASDDLKVAFSLDVP